MRGIRLGAVAKERAVGIVLQLQGARRDRRVGRAVPGRRRQGKRSRCHKRRQDAEPKPFGFDFRFLFHVLSPFQRMMSSEPK